MAYVTIPKDLTKVKSKVLFGLTKRQLICFGAAALIGVPLFFLLRRTASNSAAAFCMIIVMLPFFLLAMYERHGQPMEVVAGQIIRCMFLRTKERPYQTNNFYVRLSSMHLTRAAADGYRKLKSSITISENLTIQRSLSGKEMRYSISRAIPHNPKS